MRTGPSTDYYVITTLDNGTSLTVTDKSNPSWYGVQLGDGTTGYVFSEYLRPGSSSSTGKIINGVPYINQLWSYPTGCESVSAVMALQYAGVDISVDSFIDNYLPCGDAPYWGYDGMTGGNPWNVFLGDPRSDEGWGCYATVIAQAIRSMGTGLTVNEHYGENLDYLCSSYIDNNIPVILWATIDMTYPQSSTSWISYDGQYIEWVYPMHSLVLIGYDSDAYYFNDPISGQGVRYSKGSVETAYWGEYAQAIAVHY